MKLTSTSAATVACLGFHVLALPQTEDLSIRATVERRDTLRASRLPRVSKNDPINTYSIRDGRFTDDTRSENSKAATVSLEKRAPFGDFNVDIVLAEASVRHGFNTTLCILNLNCPTYAARVMGTDSPEAIVALRNAWSVKNINSNQNSQLSDDGPGMPNAYLTALSPLSAYQSQPTSLPTTIVQHPPSFPTVSPHPQPAIHKRQAGTDPGYEAYGCIYYNTPANDWVCKNATFAYLMIQHISSVDYDQRNGISVWTVSNPPTAGGAPGDELGAWSHCVQTTAGCNDTNADFYGRFPNPYIEPRIVTGFKEGHDEFGN